MNPRRPLIFALCLLLSAPATAQTGTASGSREWKRRFENTFAFVLNPLGIQNAFDVSWTKPTNTSDAPLHKDAHLAFGVSSKLTPAFERVGVWFEYAPLSVLDLRIGIEPVYYFGTYKAILPFDRASARFDDDVIEARVKEARSGIAGRLYLSPTLKARVGPVVARVKAELSFWRARKQESAFFYEPAWDTLIQASGSTLLSVEALALREFKRADGTTVLFGPVYDLTTVSDASVNRKQDVGLLLVWARSRNFHALKDPTVAVKAFYFLQDPWRRHEAAAQFAFAFGL